jgi:hypothetical protein
MHRVELKEASRLGLEMVNFPFLMHRVELKAAFPFWRLAFRVFLMHRVELKVIDYRQYVLKFSDVPNAPCGVES